MSTIIIEGFDNTGKTTLAKNLAYVLGHKYVSGGGPEVGTYEGALERLKKGMPNKVQDRTWISEMVYGPICRDKHIFRNDQVESMIKFHKDNKIQLIYAKRSYKEIMNTINDREQMEGVESKAKELMALYDYWMLGILPIYLGKPIFYDYEHTSLESFLTRLTYLNAITKDEFEIAKGNITLIRMKVRRLPFVE